MSRLFRAVLAYCSNSVTWFREPFWLRKGAYQTLQAAKLVDPNSGEIPNTFLLESRNHIDKINKTAKTGSYLKQKAVGKLKP